MRGGWRVLTWCHSFLWFGFLRAAVFSRQEKRVLRSVPAGKSDLTLNLDSSRSPGGTGKSETDPEKRRRCICWTCVCFFVPRNVRTNANTCAQVIAGKEDKDALREVISILRNTGDFFFASPLFCVLFCFCFEIKYNTRQHKTIQDNNSNKNI